MPRTFGARDRHPRRHRSDIGKKRKRYAGKKVKTKRQRKFEKRVGNKTHIKLRPMREERMSLEGYKNWDRKIRAKIRPVIYRQERVILTPVKDITTIKDLEEWSLVAIGKPGFYKVGGWSHGKTKTHYKRVKMFDVLITEHESGLKAKVVKDWRMFRYFFWKGK